MDRNYIVCAEFNIRSEIELEGCITVWPAAHKFSVEPNNGIRHRAVDIEIKLPSFLFGRNVEVLSIPTDSPPGQFTCLSGILLLEWSLNAPVVRKIQLTPCSIIE